MKAKCDYGEITYRMPNVGEMLELIGSLGINQHNKALNDWHYHGKIINQMEPFIEHWEISVEGKKVLKYDDLINSYEAMPALREIAENFWNTFFDVGPKKKTSRKQ